MHLVWHISGLLYRGWARYCGFTGILDSWCLLGISWMHTFFWNNYGIVKPVAPISTILFWSWGESHYWEKPIYERSVFRHLESCSTSHSLSVNICEKVKTSLYLSRTLFRKQYTSFNEILYVLFLLPDIHFKKLIQNLVKQNTRISW